MTVQELWNRYQEWLYFHEELGIYLDVSRMRFNDDLLEHLKPRFEKAFALMQELEKGAIANPDENRQVGHYWLRAPKLAPAEFRQEIIDSLDELEQFGRQIHDGTIHPPHADKFTDILAIGIGGSALGPQFVDDALVPDDAPLQIHFIDNTDPAGMDRVLARLRERLNTTLVIVTSKSGGTAETRNGMLEVKHAYERQGLDFPAHAVAITMLGSSMDELERMEGWLAEFPMFDWIGGRTSEMSPVGLLSANLLGIDIRAMLEGARLMDEATRISDIKTNPAALLAMMWYHAGNGKGEKDMVILPYKDSLLMFSRYLQQLIMESLGKGLDLDGNRVCQGITVYGNKGSTDQHAFVQQLREGIANFFVTFIEVLEDRSGPSIEVEPDTTSGDFLSSCLQGTREALYENQRESITLTIPAVNARTVGALIALYERAVGYYAVLININAYHQPGVEAGKKASVCLIALQRQILSTLKDSGQSLTITELAKQLNAESEVEAIYKIVRHLAANQRGIVLKGKLNQPASLRVQFQQK